LDANFTIQAIADVAGNNVSGFAQGLNSSVNLTGQITAIVEQPLVANAGIIGAIVVGLITGAFTLYGIKMTQKNEVDSEERKRKDDKIKTQRAERIEAYVYLISNLMLINSSQNAIDYSKLAESIARAKLLASHEIIIQIENLQSADFSKRYSIKSITNDMIRLMAEELQQEDVYSNVNESGVSGCHS